VVTVLVAILMVASGGASATPVVVKKPPYVGAQLYDAFYYRTATGCASFAHDPVPPSFNATSGLTRVVSEVGAQVCHGNNGSANLLGYVGATDITFQVPTSGMYNVSAFWNVTAEVTITVNVVGSPQGVGGGVSLGPNICIKDLTSGTVGCSGGLGGFGSAFSTSNRSTTISRAFADINTGWPLVAGHRYDLRTYVGYHVYASAAGLAGAAGTSVTVTLDMHASGKGLGAYLESVTVVR
jgi:hypothetical protein